MSSRNLPFAAAVDGVRVAVRVIPKASRAGVAGVGVDAAGRAYLRVRVNAPPEGGKANEAVIKLLAAAWDVPPSRLSLVSGAKDRRKTIHVGGDAPALLALLRRSIESSNA